MANRRSPSLRGCGVLLIGGVLFVLAVVALSWLLGIIHRRREDRRGFRAWFLSGAPHVFPDLLAAFQGALPTARRLPHVPAAVKVIRAGLLKVVSGSIVVADPAYLEYKGVSADPFEQRLPPGDWPVDVVVLRYRNGDTRVAAMRVRWNEEPIVILEPALTTADRAFCLESRRLPTIPVDSAHCSIASIEAQRSFFDRLGDLSGPSPEQFPVSEQRGKDGENLFICPSGFGDGGYCCFFGKTPQGESAALFLDFGLLGKPRRIEH